MLLIKKGNIMLRKNALLLMIVSCAVALPAKPSRHPHYTFVLPDGYVGWVQIIFNDPKGEHLTWRKNAYEINVPDSGIPRTSDIRVDDVMAVDEFYYRVVLPDGTIKLNPVPSGFVLPGFSHGGFGVMDTGGRGRGYSWFIFIGPSGLRAKIPMADWDKVVEEHQRTHHGDMRIEAPDPYPTPGRISLAPPTLN
jgi:hypothetical protein